MQIESRLRVAAIAVLLCLVAIPGPVDSQAPTPDPTGCTDGDTSCTDEAAAWLPIDECKKKAGTADPHCEGFLCLLNPQAESDLFPLCVYELVLPPGCAPTGVMGNTALGGVPIPNQAFPQPACSPLWQDKLPAGCDPSTKSPAFPQPECSGIADNALPEGCDPTVTEPAFPQPGCFPGLGALDGLCGLAGREGSFPACFDGFDPSELPEGCDPQAGGFPQTECGIDEALDGLCVAGDEAGSFPTCLDTGCDPQAPGFPQAACGLGALGPDALCVLGDPAGTFPTCLPQIGLELLDTLCSIAQQPGSFPTCLTGVAPAGCDPQATGFPQAECNLPVVGPDAVCAASDDPEGSFPDCIHVPGGLPEGCNPMAVGFPQAECGLPAVGPDAICAVANDPEGSFPACLPPTELPSGCDPQGEGFPQAGCGLPNAGPDALCVLGDPEGTFPTCISDKGLTVLDAICSLANKPGSFPVCLASNVLPPGCDPFAADYESWYACGLSDPTHSNTVPVANAGPDQSVDEGDLVTLNGSATDADGDYLMYSWSCAPSVDLSNSTDPAATFTAPEVPREGQTVVCTLTADDGLTRSSDSVDLVVADVPPPVLDIDLEFGSLARQLPDNHIGIDGFATATLAADDVRLAFDVLDGQALAGSLCTAPAITWAAPDDPVADSTDLDAGVAERFSIDVCWTEEESVVFLVKAMTASAEFPIELTVTFASTATDVNVEVEDVAATGTNSLILSNATYTPDGVGPDRVTTTFRVKDRNGNGDGSGAYGRINDTWVSGTISRLGDSRDAIVGPPSNVVGSATERDFPMSFDLPATLKDGTYTVRSVYANDQASEVVRSALLTVPNLGPSVGVAPVVALGNQRIAGALAAPLPVALIDPNIGSLNGTPTTELTLFRVAFHDTSDCTGVPASVTGLSVSFGGLPEGATATASSVNLTSAALPAGGSNLTVMLSWAQTTPADVYYLCGTVWDDGSAFGEALLATLRMNALNEGFHLTIDDGGNGLDAGSIQPGDDPATPGIDESVTTTEALRVVLSGTRGASSLAFALGDFDGPGSQTMDVSDLSLAGTLCKSLDASGTGCKDAAATLALAVPAIGGRVTFEVGPGNLLDGLEAGQPYFVLFRFSVPEGTAAGSYSSPVTVSGSPA